MNNEAEVISAEVAPVVAQAGDMVVRCAEDYSVAADFLRLVKAAQKRVADHFGPMKTAAHAAWKSVASRESAALAPLLDAERTVKTRMSEWYAEQERIREQERRRLQAEADARAEAERKRLEAQAAKMRTDAKREEYLERAAEVAAPVVSVAPAAPKIAGQSVRKTWRAVVTDKRTLARAILTDWIDWEAYVALNQGQLDRLAQRTKGVLTVPGLEFREETTLAVASK